MESLIIEKEPTQVDLHVGEDKLLSGELFLGRTTSGRRERIAELLSSRRFVPFRASDRTLLLATTKILWTRVDVLSSIDEVDTVLESDPLSKSAVVRIDLDDGSRLEGEVHYSLPGLSQRLTDFLEDAPQYMPVRTADWVYFVRLDRVAQIVPLQEPQR